MAWPLAQPSAGSTNPEFYAWHESLRGWANERVTGPVIDAYWGYGTDPSGATDSTTAINNAIAAAPHGGGVYLKNGVYRVSGSGVQLGNKQIRLFGDGVGSSSPDGVNNARLRPVTANMTAITVGTGTSLQHNGPTIERISVNNDQGTTGVRGMLIQGVNRGVVREVGFSTCQDGLQLSQAGQSDVSWWGFYDLKCYRNTRYSFHGGDSFGYWMIGGDFEVNTSTAYCIYADQLLSGKHYGVFMDGAAMVGNGVKLGWGSYCDFFGCKLETLNIGIDIQGGTEAWQGAHNRVWGGSVGGNYTNVGTAVRCGAATGDNLFWGVTAGGYNKGFENLAPVVNGNHWYGSAPDATIPGATWKPSVTGSRGGNAALASLLTGLDSAGLIVNNTTA